MTLLPIRAPELVAPGVHLLVGRPRYAINTYLVEDVLIDSGPPPSAARLLSQLSQLQIAAHALTHAHPDHYGSSHRVCEALDIPFWVSAGDTEAVEGGGPAIRPASRAARLLAKLPPPPAHPVSRKLREGDRVASFEVIETPGHSPGHISFWRESDGVLIVGDVLFNQHPLTGRVGLRPPPAIATFDSDVNWASAQRISALRPQLALFGHGPPLTDRGALERLVRKSKS